MSMLRMLLPLLACAGASAGAEPAVFRVSRTTPRHHRSLSAARDAIREHRRRARDPQAPATVVVEPGRYELTEPLVLRAEDSWTTWTAAPGATARPVHTGGRALAGTWKPPAKAGAPWTLALPENTPRFNQLFVSGQRAMRAREPEWGSFFQMKAKLPAPLAGEGFVYRGDDLASLAGARLGADGAELVIYDSWKASRRNIRALNTSDSSVVLTAGCSISIEPYANSGSRYYAENFAAACDSAGEWYQDLGSSTLLWQPRHEGEDPRTLEFIAPHLSGDLLRLDGARDVTMEGQSFMHIDWDIARTNVSSGNCQAASFLDTAAVHLRNSSGCTFRNNTVEHVGEYGIWLENASAHNLIDSSLVRDSGAGGLRIGVGKPLIPEIGGMDGSDHNTISDCTFVQGSAVYHEGNGVLIQKVSHTMLKNCEVAYYNHVGISVGWSWQYLNGSSEAHHNVVQDCHAHHFGNGDLSDLAGIYFLGVSPGSGAYGNHVHDSYPYYQFGHGTYLSLSVD
jgi:parallel beta-helix repeat protein